MCGICGIFSESYNISTQIYYCLLALQHRGQDSAGIAVADNDSYSLRKNNGLLRDTFNELSLSYLKGYMGIGHVRYPTTGIYNSESSQPFYLTTGKDTIILAHNGNLTNLDEMIQILIEKNINFVSNSDSEIMLHLFSAKLFENKLDPVSYDNIFETVSYILNVCKGGYSVILMIVGFGLIGFRDRNGIRPLIYGKLNKDYIICSESVGIDILDFTVCDDVKPGEAIIITKEGLTKKICSLETSLKPCIFEYIYLARPDSIMNGVLVYNARLNMGYYLAKKIKSLNILDIDIVVSVPDTSRTIAIEVATLLNIPYRECLVKNRYIDRTFIMATNEIRQLSIKNKLNVIKSEVNNKNLLVIDDSIVRGNTSKYIIQILRKSGAKKIYLASGAPPIKYTNKYGIDIPTQNELIAHNNTVDEIAKILNVDKLIYQNLEDLKKSVFSENNKIVDFETSVFDNISITH